MSTKRKVRERVSIKEAVSLDNEIVVYNDDVNTFDHVIETLIRVCNHTQSKQNNVL
jgi:ATP-dependent Clp protease adaptor protein ClpS